MPTIATRILTSLVVIAGLLAVAMAVRPDWVGGPRAAASAGVSQVILPPDEQVKALARRMRTKAEVVWQLTDGELSLFEAAAAFRFLNDHPPALKDTSWHRLPGTSDGEKLCRQVISWAGSHLPFKNGTDVAAAEVARLNRELADHLARHGTVDLGPVD